MVIWGGLMVLRGTMHGSMDTTSFVLQEWFNSGWSSPNGRHLVYHKLSLGSIIHAAIPVISPYYPFIPVENHPKHPVLPRFSPCSTHISWTSPVPPMATPGSRAVRATQRGQFQRHHLCRRLAQGHPTSAGDETPGPATWRFSASFCWRLR